MSRTKSIVRGREVKDLRSPRRTLVPLDREFKGLCDIVLFASIKPANVRPQ